MPKVSVVIPVYNTAQYLPECLDSVVSQTLDDIEIICVNDGSTDGSADILREYARRDARFTIIEQANAGISGARNAAVATSQSDYLHFLDGDDFMDLDALEVLHEQASRNELDVLFFDAIPFFEDSAMEEEHSSYKSYYSRKSEYSGVTSGGELLTRMSLNDEYRPSACLQLIRRDFYISAGLSFYEGILHEDNLFSFTCALQADRVEYVPKPYYHRRVRAGSVMTADKSVANFKGFFVSYLEMLRFAVVRDFDDKTSEAVAKLCDEVYRQALKVLCGLPKDQTGAIRHIDRSPEALLACALMIRQRDELQRIRALKKELKTSRRKLEAIRGSRSYRAVRFLRRLLKFGK